VATLEGICKISRKLHHKEAVYSDLNIWFNIKQIYLLQVLQVAIKRYKATK